MRTFDIRLAELQLGESVAVLNKDGDLVAKGVIEKLEPKRFSLLSLVVAGVAVDISTFQSEVAVIKLEDYEARVLPEAHGEWLEVLGRKCKHVVEAMPADVSAQVLELARSLDALIDPYIDLVDEGRNVNFQDLEKLRGRHAMTEAANVRASHARLHAAFVEKTERQARAAAKASG